MTHLFEPLMIRGVTFRNRIGVSPMCEYSSEDGFANDWHLVHLGARAVGGAGLVMTEAAAVDAIGRISPEDLGIWKDEHIDMLARIVAFIKAHGAATGIQIAHAGRKASVARPWDAGAGHLVPPESGGWQVVSPGDEPFSDTYGTPHALTLAEIQGVCESFVAAAHRADRAGFDVIEIHGAHGYLIHEFLSPLVNHRDDAYGGSFENRARLLLEVIRAIRSFWEKPLFVRLSVTDWVEEGWTAEDSVRLAGMLKDAGVDLVDCSSGGAIPGVKIPTAPGYQVPLAEAVRNRAGMPSAAVGLITTPEQADAIIREGKADMIMLGREMLRDPYFALHAANALGHPAPVPPQYLRAF